MNFSHSSQSPICYGSLPPALETGRRARDKPPETKAEISGGSLGLLLRQQQAQKRRKEEAEAEAERRGKAAERRAVQQIVIAGPSGVGKST